MDDKVTEGNARVTVLVTDDELENRKSVQKILVKEGYRVLTAADGNEALDTCRNHRVHVLLTDLNMPNMDGIELTRALDTASPDTEVVVMTAYGTVDTAVRAMREGASDFIEKPLKRADILRSVSRLSERHRLLLENQDLKREISHLKKRKIVGSSAALRRALSLVEQAAPSTATVLILGESGTGKELLARAVHDKSGRTGTFVAVNLAALPETIIESELFGHTRGAFTGAVDKRDGRIAQAAGGTLFLDEIGELSSATQVKLLRVLQEGEFEPLGGKTQRADFRLVAATNRDLKEAVASGEFREDLYYRLNVIAIDSPPLRARREDIALLVEHFIKLYAGRNGKAPLRIEDEAMAKLMAYPWPGNVRELENVIERAVVLDRDGALGLANLPEQIAESDDATGSLSFSIGTPLEEIERRVIRATLHHTDGDKQLAAKLLGISARTIYRKLD